MIMPGIVDAAAMKPRSGPCAPKFLAKSGSTGFFDIVELRIANAPMADIVKKKKSFREFLAANPFHRKDE